VRIEPIIRRRAVEPDIVELDLADIENVETLDHAVTRWLLLRNVARLHDGGPFGDFAPKIVLQIGTRPPLTRHHRGSGLAQAILGRGCGRGGLWSGALTAGLRVATTGSGVPFGTKKPIQ